MNQVDSAIPLFLPESPNEKIAVEIHEAKLKLLPINSLPKRHATALIFTFYGYPTEVAELMQ